MAGYFRWIGKGYSLLVTTVFMIFLASSAQAETVKDALGRDVPIRASGTLMTLGSDVTEIVYALGAGDRVIAVDRGSKYPEATSTKHNVGYRRQLSAEGLVALAPDMIVAAEDIGPPETVEILKTLEIPVVFIPEDNSGEGIQRKIALIAKVLDRQEDGKALAQQVQKAFDDAVALSSAVPEDERKKVVFFHGLVRLSAAGANTAADAIIKLAGGLNPMDEVRGYHAASEEKLVELAPDVILMMGDGKGGPTPDVVFANRALAATPAAKNKALIVLDGAYMIGFGPRTAEAIRDLSNALYGKNSITEP